MIFFTRKPLLVFSSNLFILFEFCLNNHHFVKLFLILPPLWKGHPYERKILSVLPQKDNTHIYILLWLYEFKCYYQEAVWFGSDSLTQLNTGVPSFDIIELLRALSKIILSISSYNEMPDHHQAHSILPLSWTKKKRFLLTCLNF